MRADEQTYPIEKPTDVENVWKFSAFQVAFLLRATNHEAMFAVAKDYRDTADKLDRTADTIKSGAADLAAAWRGNAAGDSLSQLRQYYASARSLAAGCRASAVAMEHAAQALGEARYREALLPGGDFPSTDPTSPESLEYQKLLSDLNGAYREAIALAPNQLAITLPDSRPIERSKWEDTGSILVEHPTMETAPGFSAGTGSGPTILAPVLPPNRHKAVPAPPMNLDPTPDDPRDPGVRKSRRTPDVELPGSGVHRRQDIEDDPFTSRTTLAGASGLPSLGLPDPDLTERTPTSSGGASGLLPRESGGSKLDGYGRATNNSSGVIPAGQGRGGPEETLRERRYYLAEDVEVWGVLEAVPSVIYGELERQSPDSDDDDDDDF